MYIRQRDAMDCGPSCLGMIVYHYGKTPNMETIRKRCSLGKDGVSLLGIARTAETLGFKTLGGHMTFETLAKEVNLPAIVHWEQNHFVIVQRIKHNRKGRYWVDVADPAKGFVSYSYEEFCEHWVSTISFGEERGIALLLEPTSAFYKLPDETKVSSRQLEFLWSYVRSYKSYFALLTLGLALGSFIQLIFPFLTQSIVDIGIGGQNLGFIWLVLLAQTMLLVSRTLIDFIRNKLLLHISTRMNLSLISDFLIKLMKLPMGFFDVKLMSDLLQRVEDHKRVELFLSSSSLSLLFSFFTFLVFSVVLYTYSLFIFLIFFTGSLLYAWWITIFLKQRKMLDYKYFEQAGLNQNTTYQLVQSMQEIKLQGCEERKRWEWEDIQAELFTVRHEVLNLQQTQQAGSLVINELKNILITVVAASSGIRGEMTLGMMLAIQYIIGQLSSPVSQLIQFIYSWQDVSISLERMSEIHNETNEEDEKRNIHTLAENKEIVIRGLCFKYDKISPDYILRDINLRIPEGQVTAIVGASGSGKTTLIKLLLGYYPLDEGTIEVGEIPLSQLNLQMWRSYTGAVMQEGYLFSDTIARNISISDATPDLEKIREACRVANIAEHIEALPLAYNTKIGQDGQGISQGQRQRILIARLVYKNPQFVFLDEATNALDANNERRIGEGLEAFYRGKTVVVVAHRLSTVCHADNIVVLDAGHIVEQGSHEELTALKGKYYALVKSQLELGS